MVQVRRRQDVPEGPVEDFKFDTFHQEGHGRCKDEKLQQEATKFGNDDGEEDFILEAFTLESLIEFANDC